MKGSRPRRFASRSSDALAAPRAAESSRAWWPPLLAGALFLAAVAVLVWREVPVDDAYITFRYAENLAAGEGVVFNPGERVEGYSSLSWLLLLGATAALHLPVPIVAVVLGTLSGLATLLLLARYGGRAGEIAAVLTAAFLPFCYHAANGLETGLFALLVTLLTVSPPPTAAWRWPVVFGAALLPLTRPEGLLLLLLWWVLWSALLRDASSRWRHVAAATGLGVWVIALGWRWAYFGDWIPNSARAKLMPLHLAWPRGARDLASFGWAAGGLGILLLAAAFATWRAARAWRAAKGAEPTLARACFVLAAAGALATSGGDSFPLWRFLVPLAPTFFLVAAEGLVAAPSTPGNRRASRVAWGIAVVAALALAHAGSSWVLAIRQEGTWARHWRQVGARLRSTLPADTVIALCPVGAIPYFSRLRTVDMLGLTDRHVARQPPDLRYWYPGHQRHDGAYVLSRRPDLILLANGPAVQAPAPFRWQDVRPYEQDVARQPGFRADYVLWHLPLGDGRHVQAFARRASLHRLGNAGR